MKPKYNRDQFKKWLLWAKEKGYSNKDFMYWLEQEKEIQLNLRTMHKIQKEVGVILGRMKYNRIQFKEWIVEAQKKEMTNKEFIKWVRDLHDIEIKMESLKKIQKELGITLRSERMKYDRGQFKKWLLQAKKNDWTNKEFRHWLKTKQNIEIGADVFSRLQKEIGLRLPSDKYRKKIDIYKARKRLRLSQSQLGSFLGICGTTVGRMERGETRAKSNHVEKVRQLLDLHPFKNKMNLESIVNQKKEKKIFIDNYNIKDKRLEMGMSQRMLAEYLNLSKSTIRDLESGKISKIKKDYVDKIDELIKSNSLNHINLYDARKKLGMSQKTFADKLGVARTTLIRLEKNDTKITQKYVERVRELYIENKISM